MATTVSCSISPAAPAKRCVLPARIIIALDGTGAGSDVVTFSPEFDNVPVVGVAGPLGVTYSGSLSAGTPTKSGTTVAITGASIVSQNIEVVFFAHEKL